MKNHFNYLAARAIIEDEHGKDLDGLANAFRDLGMKEDQIKKELDRVIDTKIKMTFEEVNGELVRKQ